MSVFANKKSIVHAGDGLKFVAAAPDVCKTPSPGGPIPVPYPNFAMSSDRGDGTKTVKIEGKSVAVKGAKLKTSTGDEAGTAGGGIVSSKTRGAVKWLLTNPPIGGVGDQFAHELVKVVITRGKLRRLFG